MKVIINESADCTEIEVQITCPKVTERLQRLIEHVKMFSFSIMATKDGAVVPVELENVFYFDTVDNKTFLYMEQDVYRCDKRLYELEELLADTPFVRISKSCILNISCVVSVQAQFSGRLQATLSNGEKVIVSKHYIKAFRDKFKREEGV